MPRYFIRFEKGSFGYNFHTYYDKKSDYVGLTGCVLTLEEVNDGIKKIIAESSTTNFEILEV